MKRRQFITLLGGAVVAPLALWPLQTRAQPAERMRRLAMLSLSQESDPNTRANLAALLDGLSKLGWTVGRNLQIDYRWAAVDPEKIRTGAAELLRLAPDVVLAPASPVAAAMQQQTRTIPIVFIMVSEPVAQGFVQSLAHPGGNLTGFANLEGTFATKLPEMLKEIAPRVTRVSIIFSPDNSGAALLARSAAAAAPTFGLASVLAPVRGPAEIEAAITALAREPGGGVILTTDAALASHHKLIVELTARSALPAVSGELTFAAAGGLLSYGVSIPGQFRQAAAYVDRILRGDKPADLPVQQPTKLELVINLKTAKALGLTVPLTLQASADEVIE
jgi:putative tryptophan/tyrosine transport system substrate-binding protein